MLQVLVSNQNILIFRRSNGAFFGDTLDYNGVGISELVYKAHRVIYFDRGLHGDRLNAGTQVPHGVLLAHGIEQVLQFYTLMVQEQWIDEGYTHEQDGGVPLQVLGDGVLVLGDRALG